MPSLRRALFGILAIFSTTALNERQYLQRYLKRDPDFLEYWLDRSVDVAFLACAGHKNPLGHPVFSVLPKAWTLWSYPPAGAFLVVLKNTVINTKTAVFVLNPDENQKCLGRLRETPMLTYTTDWIALPTDSTTFAVEVNSLNQSTRLCSDKSASKSIQDGKFCLSFKGAVVISRKYGTFDTARRGTFISAFSGKKVQWACMLIPEHSFGNDTSCAFPPFTLVFNALEAINATHTLTSYPSPQAVFKAMLKGSVDVFAFPVMMEESGFGLSFYPQAMQYTRQKFYVHRNKSLERRSVFKLVVESYVGFLFLLVITLLVWLALSVFDYLAAGRFQRDAIIDSGTFLVASFLANSVPLEVSYFSRGVYFPSIARGLTICAWFLGIVPLSSYLRSEFTSRLTITQPPGHIDTVEKLSEALERKEMQPCIVKDGCFYPNVMGVIPDIPQTLETKLGQAFQRSKIKMLFQTNKKCLECASKPGFVCLLCVKQRCNAFVRTNLVESRDSLKVTLVTTPVRKSYPLAKAYDQLLRRLFETAAPPFNKHTHCKTEMLEDSRSDSGVETNPVQLLDLSQFFWFYLSLLFISVFALGLELIFSRLMHLRWVLCTSRITDFEH